MSRQMKRFADYFMSGLQLGAGWAEKWQAQQIAKERNRIMDERYRKQDARENAKMQIYAHGVYSKAETDKIRAQAALNRGRGGGGGGSFQDFSGMDAAMKNVGLGAPAAPAQPAAPVTNNYYSTDGGESGDVAAPPAAEPSYGGGSDEVLTQARGGMVRKMAEGGIVGGMSLQEAQGYQGSSSPKQQKPSAGSALNSAMAKAAGSYKAPEKEKEKPEGAITPTAAPAGGYNVTLNEDGTTTTTSNYRQGGRVRRYQSGGRVMEAIDTGTSGPGSGYGYRAAPPGTRRY